MKHLIIDIELAPNLAHVWSIWNVNVGVNQIIDSAEMLSFAAKWEGHSDVEFFSQFHDGHEQMVYEAHRLLSEADVVTGFNSKKFDVRHLQREFLEFGLGPPAPFQQIDLLDTMKKKFLFPSNKLDYVSRALGIGGKTQHAGHELWIRCMNGDPEAWATMKEYNRNDVLLTEELYFRVRPWIASHPNRGLYDDRPDTCPACASTNLEKQGNAYTSISIFQRYKCRDCSKWSRSGKATARSDIRGVAA